MFSSNFSVYFGADKEEQFIGFTAEKLPGGNQEFFAILSADAGLEKENGKEFLKKISIQIGELKIETLNDFDTFIAEKFQEFSLPAGSSFAGAFIQEKKCLLKTIGDGEVILKRDNKIAKLIQGDNSASGFIKNKDFFIITTSVFSTKLGGIDELNKVIDSEDPSQVKDSITPDLKAREDTGLIALLFSFKKEEEVQTESPSLKESVKKERGQGKNLIRIVVIAIFLIFLWSTIYNFQQKFNSDISKKIQIKKELISANLSQAEDVAFLNMRRAQSLILEAKKNFQSLKKEIGDKNLKDMTDIEKMINDKEKSLFKKEEKSFSEFFDLTVDMKDAKGTKLYLDQDNLVILDPKGKIYILSISKKSLDKKNSSEITNTSLIGQHEKTVFFLKNEGIFRMSDGNKVQKIVEHDSDWGKIKDMVLYNGNIYLMDLKANQIYKYTSTDGSYSSKFPYLKSAKDVDLSDANSLAIDASVYIGFPDSIVKYTSGLRDGFNPIFPDKDTKMVKIYTNKDMEKIYAWDKKKGVVYMISKSGEYEKQIQSPILQKANDLIVFDRDAYILSSSKIYKMSLE